MGWRFIDKFWNSGEVFFPVFFFSEGDFKPHVYSRLYFIGYNIGVYCVDQDSERANIEDAHALQVLTLYGSEVDNNNLHLSFFKLIIHIFLMFWGKKKHLGFMHITLRTRSVWMSPHETVK